jgi:hypothetical protein
MHCIRSSDYAGRARWTRDHGVSIPIDLVRSDLPRFTCCNRLHRSAVLHTNTWHCITLLTVQLGLINASCGSSGFMGQRGLYLHLA